MKVSESNASLARLTTELRAVSAERDNLSEQVFTARAEKEDMVNLANTRKAEVTRAEAKMMRAQKAEVTSG